MPETPQATTTTVLLEALFENDNHDAWNEFHERYVPIILAFARKLGLGEHDAADVAQETLARFIREYRTGKFDRTRGRLRSWLIGIAKYRVADVRRGQANSPVNRGESALLAIPSDDELGLLWESERRAAILRRALSELRTASRIGESTIRAFEQFVLRERPAADVADELGLTAQDVYMAKNRVAARLREIITRIEPLYDDE